MFIYTYRYQHQTKEVILTMQIGTTPPMSAIMSAEAFIQDIDFMRKDPKLSHFLTEVAKRKDLPIDHDFGTDAEIKFSDKWEGKMGGIQ